MPQEGGGKTRRNRLPHAPGEGRRETAAPARPPQQAAPTRGAPHGGAPRADRHQGRETGWPPARRIAASAGDHTHQCPNGHIWTENAASRTPGRTPREHAPDQRRSPVGPPQGATHPRRGTWRQAPAKAQRSVHSAFCLERLMGPTEHTVPDDDLEANVQIRSTPASIRSVKPRSATSGQIRPKVGDHRPILRRVRPQIRSTPARIRWSHPQG